jgi:hypothetical protein
VRAEVRGTMGYGNRASHSTHQKERKGKEKKERERVKLRERERARETLRDR